MWGTRKDNNTPFKVVLGDDAHEESSVRLRLTNRINPAQTKKTDDLGPRTIFQVFFRTESIFLARPVKPCVLRFLRHQVKK